MTRDNHWSLAFAHSLGYPKRESKSRAGLSVKKLSSWRAALALLAPVLVLWALVLAPTGNVQSQTTVTGPAGTLLIALTGAPPTPVAPFVPGFSSLRFNVLAVKLNPSTDPNIFSNQSDPNWVTVPVAAAVGVNNTGTVDVFTQLEVLFDLNNSNGPNPGGAGTGPSELQVDLKQIQTVPILFNSVLVPANTYHAIELVLDGSNAGTAVPTCLQTPASMLEGCIASQISMVNPSAVLPVLTTGTGFSVP